MYGTGIWSSLQGSRLKGTGLFYICFGNIFLPDYVVEFQQKSGHGRVCFFMLYLSALFFNAFPKFILQLFKYT